jgi:hypothetical protein
MEGLGITTSLVVCVMWCSDTNCSPEASGSVVRMCAVVVQEYLAVTTITEECSTKRPNLRRRADPTRGFRVELAQLLQRSVLFLGQQVDTHCGCHTHRAVLRFVLLPRCKRFAVVANTPTPRRALWRAIAEDVHTRLFVLANDVWLSARGVHLTERSQRRGTAFESGLDLGPCHSSMTVHVLREARLQCAQQVFLFGLSHVAQGCVHGRSRIAWTAVVPDFRVQRLP